MWRNRIVFNLGYKNFGYRILIDVDTKDSELWNQKKLIWMLDLGGNVGIDKFATSVSGTTNIISSSTCIQYDGSTDSFKFNATCGQATAVCETKLGESYVEDFVTRSL